MAMVESFKTVMIWAANVNIPWFLAGAAVGVPAGVTTAGATTTGDGRVFALVSSYVNVRAVRSKKCRCGCGYREVFVRFL